MLDHIFSKPLLGRSSRGFLSHLTLTMHTRNTESEAWHCSKVSLGKGLLTASIAALPIRASFRSSLKPCFSQRAARATLVVAVILGLMPSPGRRVMATVPFLDKAAREMASQTLYYHSPVVEAVGTLWRPGKYPIV